MREIGLILMALESDETGELQMMITGLLENSRSCIRY